VHYNHTDRINFVLHQKFKPRGIQDGESHVIRNWRKEILYPSEHQLFNIQQKYNFKGKEDF